MSHFCTVVLCRSNDTDDRATLLRRADEMLSPYSEHIEVEPYLVDCFCIGREAMKQATEAADTAAGPLDRWRVRYWKMSDEERDELTWEDFISEWREAYELAESRHPLCQRPDPECPECLGTGQRDTIYNPRAKWDWYQLGGRFTGSLAPAYDPHHDPRNIETCTLCNGTGARPDMTFERRVDEEGRVYCTPTSGVKETLSGGIEGLLIGDDCETGRSEEGDSVWPIELAEPVDWCNGCEGTGQRLKWPTEWVDFEGDIQPVATARELRFVPFAVVDGEGRWHESGEMGWFGISSNEKPEAEWNEIVMRLYEDHESGYVAMVFDLHI